jgi:hypothetical protein
MSVRMKTTLNLSDRVMRRVKEEVARRGMTISALIEAAVRRYLEDEPGPVDLPPLPRFASGGAALDVADRDELYEAMGGR